MGCPSEEFPQAVVGLPLDLGRAREHRPGGRSGRIRLRSRGLPGSAAGHRRQRRAASREAQLLPGRPVAEWDERTRQLIRLTAGDIDARAATSVWDAALASSWEQAPAWVHGDLAPSNVLVAGGALHAVIDFGGAAIGDPACDLVMEWEFFTGDSAAAFRRGLHLDEATWARGRGWALWKALVTISQGNGGGGDAKDAARRTIGLVIADHARSAGR